MSNLALAGLVLAAAVAASAQSPYAVTGQVQDAAGKAACGVRVCALADDFDPLRPGVSIPCGTSDKAGGFVINLERPGRYRLVYTPAEGGPGTYPTFFRQPGVPLPEAFVTGESPRASVRVSMSPKNGLLVGRSVDAATGLPVESVRFVMCHESSPELCWHSAAKNTEGAFSLPAPYVPFTLRVKADGFEEWAGPDGVVGPALSVAPESSRELSVLLRRTSAAAGRAIGEAEKVAGVHLPAPAQLSPADEAVYEHYPRRTRLEWSPVEGAASYSVEVDYCLGNRKGQAGCADPRPHGVKTDPPTSGIAGTSYEFFFVGAQAGRWRVWAVDAQGREGFKSPWRRFVYLN